jgi:hypothetical protein
MLTKMFEVRDRDTFIPVVATKLSPDTRWNTGLEKSELDAEKFLLESAGYRDSRHYILLSKIDGGSCKSNYTPFGWDKNDGRTMFCAHEFIEQNFDSLESGEVIDVEYLLHETKVKKETQRIF